MKFDTNDEGRIRMYGGIGDDISSTMFMDALDEMGGRDITIQLQSGGGDVITGLSIHHQIQNYPGRVTVNVDTLSASIASVLMMAADVVNVSPTSRLMIHRAWGIAFGDASEFRQTADLLETFDMQIAATYAERAGGTQDRWFALMEKETWFTADEAVESGLADGIVTGVEEPSGTNNATALSPVASLKRSAGNSPTIAAMMRAMKLKQELLRKGVI